MFLLPYKQTPRGEQVMEFILYTLWDLGLKVGQAVRTLDEALHIARDDIGVRTSLLESRHLRGDGELFRAFWRRFDRRLMATTGPAFVEAKLAERDARHRRMGDSRYVLEPNVKEGKGGLRDLQTLSWIAKYLYRVRSVDDLVAGKVLTAEDARRFKKAADFLWTARCHLHYLAGRAEERLTFDSQTAVGARMGYTPHAGTRGVERFMKHYFLVAKDVGELTRILCAVLEEQHKKKTSRFAMRWFAGPDRTVAGFPGGERPVVRGGARELPQRPGEPAEAVPRRPGAGPGHPPPGPATGAPEPPAHRPRRAGGTPRPTACSWRC